MPGHLVRPRSMIAPVVGYLPTAGGRVLASADRPAERMLRFACLLAIVILALGVGLVAGYRAAGSRPVDIHYVPVPVRESLASSRSVASVETADPTLAPLPVATRQVLTAPPTRSLALVSVWRPVRTPVRMPVEPPVQAGPVLAGHAVWHPTGSDGWFGAAGPELRRWLGAGWRGSYVRVCTDDACVRVRLDDWCRCSDDGRLVDLSDEAFRRLAPLSQGVIKVTIGR